MCMYLYECIELETRKRIVRREDKILRRAIKHKCMKAIGKGTWKEKGIQPEGDMREGRGEGDEPDT